MAERIPRSNVPRNTIAAPSVGTIRVQNAGRLNSIPRPVTSRLEPPKIRTSLPPVTTNLRPPTVRTPELEILQYESPIVRPSVNPGLGGGFPSQQNQNEEEAEDTRSLPPPMPVPVKPEQPVITLPYISELPIPPPMPVPVKPEQPVITLPYIGELPIPPPMPVPVKPEQPVITLPYIGELPVPPYETVVLSGTTAVATVAATLIGKDIAAALLKWMKPIVKQAMLKAKKALKGDLTPYETQELLVFEGEKKLMKQLKKEQKAEKLRQALEHQVPLHQRTRRRMEKRDENKPQT